LFVLRVVKATDPGAPLGTEKKEKDDDVTQCYQYTFPERSSLWL
jgi:hypothetical protein